MDQLKPLIKHHYWICFGLSVIFVVVGWWMASGNLSAAITARKEQVDKAFSSASQGGDSPNSTWIEAAKKVNETDRKAYDDSSRALWQRQKDARIWHSALQQEMQGIPYNGTISRASTRSKWGALYGDQFDALLKIVQPFDRKEGTGLVVVDKRRITHRPYDSWRLKAPTSDEIWKNQEDIWLLKALLTSLARVNEGASRITDASLREILALRLRGGDREYKPSSGGGGGMGGMGMGGMGGFGGGEMSTGAGGGGMGMDMYAGAGGMPGAGVGGAPTGPWKQFEGTFGMDLLSEEFGPVAAGGMGGMGMPGEMSSDPAAGGGATPMMAGGGFGGGFGGGMGGMGAGAAVEADRYVDDSEALPYKTRAFFLHVRIREDQIPRLLAELTNSDFPVEIVRVDLKTFGVQSGGPGGMSDLYSAGGAGGSMLDGGAGLPEGGGLSGDLAGGYADPAAGYGDLAAGGYGDPAGMSTPGALGDPGLGMLAGAPDLAGGGELGYGAGDYGMQANDPLKTGQQVLSAAMTDPALVELRVGGLMTLYQSKEETVAENATEAAAAQESGVQSTSPPAGEASSADPAAAAPGTDPAAAPGAAPAPEAAPAGDQPAPAAAGDPATVDPAAPAADPAATPGTAPASDGPPSDAAPASPESAPVGAPDGAAGVPDPAGVTPSGN